MRAGIAVRVHDSCAEDLRLELDSRPCLNARSLFTQQLMWQHWEDKGGEERNRPPYRACRRLRTSVLANRHSLTYECIGDYLYFCMRTLIQTNYAKNKCIN